MYKLIAASAIWALAILAPGCQAQPRRSAQPRDSLFTPVPGLKIDGEIGQQLGYANAAGVATVNFIILIIIGWAYAHKPQARAWVSRVVRRRRR